jgi:hypothetical protein
LTGYRGEICRPDEPPDHSPPAPHRAVRKPAGLAKEAQLQFQLQFTNV